MATQDDLVSQFCDITGTSPEQASQYLAACNWDLDTAATSFLADQDEASSGPSAGASAEPEYTGPRTLDGRPAPQYSSSSSAAAGKRPAKRTGLATLGSLGHDHEEEDDDDDEEEDERKGPRDLFAGGEKSGIAVQDPAQRSSDPRKLIDDIVAKAKANARRPEGGSSSSAAPEPSNRFKGSGQTLGGDGVESRTIPDPSGSPIPTPGRDGPVQERTLHLWSDGFSIDDGDLIRFDDPEHVADLQMIRQGRAPLHLMNVRYDQPVDVKLQQHQEKYHPLPKKYKPFSGEGRRLGSPVPGDGSSSGATAAAAAAAAVTTTSQPTAAAGQPPSTGVDESQPTLVLRIQLPDGTRLPARFNTTQTIGDIYEFIALSLPAGSSGRAWVLATTFPNKEHTDKSLVLGEVVEFKKGGTAVVKWT